ncbi:MAG TPA: sulfite oxidase [Acidobacteriaceae bacterium]|nr:sulfite oxidase [Acidobacteriaceae bacterium]
MVIRQREPVNLESPFGSLDGVLTPNALFYVRSHFKAPVLRAEEWRLEIGGAVRQGVSLGLEELMALPAVTRMATLECAGNGRVFLVPQTEGAQWELGAVSTAEWTGVPLRAVLERAGMLDGATEVVLEGADQGVPKEAPVPPGEIRYARSLPLAKLDEVLLAYRMNGEPLAEDHGFPVRAVVPGWYGMASVKWLTRILVVREAFRGYFQTSDYASWEYVDGQPVRVPLGPMQLKSAIARPGVREVVAAGATYEVTGAAWGGDAGLARVEVSADDGATWAEAQWMDPEQSGVWRRWRFAWPVPAEAGRRVLRARVWDRAGRTQPEEHDKRFGNYVIHHPLPIEVEVR